jgi:hypothetical protein
MLLFPQRLLFPKASGFSTNPLGFSKAPGFSKALGFSQLRGFPKALVFRQPLAHAAHAAQAAPKRWLLQAAPPKLPVLFASSLRGGLCRFFAPEFNTKLPHRSKRRSHQRFLHALRRTALCD